MNCTIFTVCYFFVFQHGDATGPRGPEVCAHTGTTVKLFLGQFLKEDTPQSIIFGIDTMAPKLFWGSQLDSS